MKSKNCGYEYKHLTGVFYANSLVRRKHIFEVPMRYCMTQERNAQSVAACPLSCEGEPVEKVCGSDGNIYDSECEMKSLTCGYGLV